MHKWLCDAIRYSYDKFSLTVLQFPLVFAFNWIKLQVTWSLKSATFCFLVRFMTFPSNDSQLVELNTLKAKISLSSVRGVERKGFKTVSRFYLFDKKKTQKRFLLSKKLQKRKLWGLEVVKIFQKLDKIVQNLSILYKSLKSCFAFVKTVKKFVNTAVKTCQKLADSDNNLLQLRNNCQNWFLTFKTCQKLLINCQTVQNMFKLFWLVKNFQKVFNLQTFNSS